MPETTSTQIRIGRYLVKRTFELDGYAEELALECNNPAYGYAELDRWQLSLLEARRPKPSSEAA